MSDKWIRTEDAAPEAGKAVLVHIDGYTVPVTGTRMKNAGPHLRWRIGNRILRKGNYPTHWMELPDAPDAQEGV